MALSDAHDRSLGVPRPTKRTVAQRVHGRDRIEHFRSYGEPSRKRTPPVPSAAYQASRTPSVQVYNRPKSRRSDPVGNFLKGAASAFGDLPLVAFGSGKTGKQVAPKLPQAAGEMSGFSSLRRIRNKEAGLSDYAVLAGLMAGPVGRSASMALRTTPKFAITPEMSRRMLDRVEFNVKAKEPGLQELIDMYNVPKHMVGVPPGKFGKIPRRVQSGDVGFDERIPFLTNKRDGSVIVGDIGDVHGGLWTPEAKTKYFQGMSMKIAPDAARQHPGLIMTDLGFGPRWGKGYPEDPSGLLALLQHAFRNFDDADIMFPERTLGQRWVPQREVALPPTSPTLYEDFAAAERARRRRR